MSVATHNQIKALLPDIDDHAIVEILKLRPSVAELEAALALMTSDDEDLVAFEHEDGSRLHGLANLLLRAGVNSPSDPDR